MLANTWQFLRSEYGNLASAISLVISLYLLYRLKAEAAAIRKTAKEAVERVSAQFLLHDLSESLWLLLGARESCRSAKWTQAVDRCEDCQRRLAKLSQKSRLSTNHQERIGFWVDNLRLIIISIRKISFAPSEKQRLSAKNERALDQLISFLAEIQGRLEDLSMENIHD